MQRKFAAARLGTAATLLSLALAATAQAGPALDRIAADKKIRLGMREDAPPFSFIADGHPAGFSVELCGLMAGAILETSKLENLDGTFVPVDAENRFDALAKGDIDVLCGATTATLSRREMVSFSIPTFSTGVGAVVARDAPDAVKQVLLTLQPEMLSKADFEKALSGTSVGALAGTTAADWLETGPLSEIDGIEVTTFDDHAAGIAAAKDGTIAAYFADKALIQGTLSVTGQTDSVEISSTTFTHEPYALALPRDDEDLRLVVDRALSDLYRSGKIFGLYEKYFGKPNAQAVLFYNLVALPD
jgi:polar amino acid transport system substrate-binding protein